MQFIDLRSDTVSLPTPAMREAMANAQVGDDVLGEDPTVNRLEVMAVERVGKEAALFVPVFDVQAYLATGPSGMSTIQVRNILGFFVEGMCADDNKAVCGRLTSIPGDFVQGSSTVSTPSSFLRKVVLIR